MCRTIKTETKSWFVDWPLHHTQSFSLGTINASSLMFVFLASFSFSIAFFLMFKGINLIGAVNTAMILNLEPVFTIGLAFLILNEVLSLIQLIGAACVLLAIFVIQRYQHTMAKTE